LYTSNKVKRYVRTFLALNCDIHVFSGRKETRDPNTRLPDGGQVEIINKSEIQMFKTLLTATPWLKNSNSRKIMMF